MIKMGEPILIVESLFVDYPELEGSFLEVIADLSFKLCESEKVAIVGPNGCGKSTLLKAIAGLIPVKSGNVHVFQKNKRDKFGMVFQNYSESLFPYYTVKKNLSFPLANQGIKRKERENRIDRFLAGMNVGIDPKKYPYQLSGGQQQLVAILRSLIQEPNILMLDEPFKSLDYHRRANIYRIVDQIFSKTEQALILVSHEPDEAVFFSDTILVMSEKPSKIVEYISVDIKRPRKIEDMISDEFVDIQNKVITAINIGAKL